MRIDDIVQVNGYPFEGMCLSGRVEQIEKQPCTYPYGVRVVIEGKEGPISVLLPCKESEVSLVSDQ